VAQRSQQPAWLPAQAQDVLRQLGELGQIPADGWKIHLGNLPHGEDPELDDTGWPEATRQNASTTDAVWYRKWIEVPASLQGYDLTGAKIEFSFGAQEERTNAPNDQGYLAVNEIVYFDGRRVAMGENLEPILLFSHAKPGDKILIAVKLLATPTEKSMARASLRIDFAPGRPSPTDLRDELMTAAIFVHSENKQEPALTSAFQSVDLQALKSGDQKAFDASLLKAHADLEPLRPLFANVSYVLTGQSHIDAAYRWPWTETVDVVRHTFDSALQLMDEYPGYTFSQSATQYNAWMARKYPNMNDEIKQRVKEGRWEIVGGMWVEPDFNIPGGESQVRQLLVGKRWDKAEYGVDVKVGWNPDSFGFDWQLPQIYKKSGVDYFMTTKMSWNETNKLPFHLFWWQAPDGSRVLTYFPPNYSSGSVSPSALAQGYEQLKAQAPGLPEIMDVYGVGDHGGGATRVTLDEATRWMQPGAITPTMHYGTSLSFFTGIEGKIASDSPVWNYRTVATGDTRLPAPDPGKISIPTWKDELYLEYHRGTYTSQAAQKRGIRRGEESLLDAEQYASLAWLDGSAYPADELNDAWKKLLFNEFHDLAAGSGAEQIYKDAQDDFTQIKWATNEISSKSLGVLERQIDTRVSTGVPVVVFNPLAWQRTGLVNVDVQMPAPSDGVTVLGTDNQPMPLQVVSKDAKTNTYHLLLEAKDLPSMGYAVLRVVPGKRAFATDLKAHGLTIENGFLRVTVDPHTGCITSLYDKKDSFESLAAGACGNQLLAYTDIPKVWDAWNIDADYIQHPIDLGPAKSVELVESGPLRAVIRVTRATQLSKFTQDITLYAGLDYVNVVNDFDWHETHVLLKAAFPLAASSNFATYEIPYGTIERPTTRNNSWEDAKFEVPAQHWADLGDGSHGVSLINESKYGYDAKGNVLRLTLLRSPVAPDIHADRGLQHFSYALYPHAGTWKTAMTVRRGYDYNYPILAMQAIQHEGPLPSRHSFLSLTGDNVVLTAVKKAEDGNSLVMRFYEWAGQEGNVRLDVPPGAISATVANMMETPDGEPLAVSANHEITVPIHPYEIQTIRVDYPHHQDAAALP
jgi:alpha-mannosidase